MHDGEARIICLKFLAEMLSYDRTYDLTVHRNDGLKVRSVKLRFADEIEDFFRAPFVSTTRLYRNDNEVTGEHGGFRDITSQGWAIYESPGIARPEGRQLCMQ